MNIKSYLNKLIDSSDIKHIAKENVLRWADECDPEKRKSILKSELCFISHKYCFESSLIDYPYIESTFDIVFSGEEIGRYRLISLTDGSIEDDYFEIY